MDGNDGTFPHVLSCNTSTYKGIEMRDYIAIHAMQGLLANAADKFSDEQIADMAYKLADKMILRSQED